MVKIHHKYVKNNVFLTYLKISTVHNAGIVYLFLFLPLCLPFLLSFLTSFLL